MKSASNRVDIADSVLLSITIGIEILLKK